MKKNIYTLIAEFQKLKEFKSILEAKNSLKNSNLKEILIS